MRSLRLALLILAPSSMLSQAVKDTLPFHRSVASAEEEGARWPRVVGRAGGQGARPQPATAVERRCVQATDFARSGELTIKPFYSNTPSLATVNSVHTADSLAARSSRLFPAVTNLPQIATPSGKHGPTVSWLAARIDGAPLKIRVARLSDVAYADTARMVAYASYSGGDAWYLGSLEIPSPGTWLVVAAVNENWGCFVFSAR